MNGKDIMSILNLKAGPSVKEWVRHSSHKLRQIQVSFEISGLKYIFIDLLMCSNKSSLSGNLLILLELRMNAKNGSGKLVLNVQR